MSDARKILRKIVANAYDDTAAAGESFDLDLIREVVRSEASTAALGDQLLDMAINDAVSYVDDSRRSRAEQAEMFGDLDRVLAVGEGVRRRKGSCGAREYAAHMTIVSANVASVTAAAAREQQEYARLLPYLSAEMTVEQAVTAIKAEGDA